MLPLARTNEEAHLFMDLRPCACGSAAFSRASAVVTDGDDLAALYTGACEGCGEVREFRFRLPAATLPPTTPMRYGAKDLSELLDPGEWLAAADKLSSQPMPPSNASPEERYRAAALIDRAAAAIDEVMKFVPPGADAVPLSAFRSELGRVAHAREPGRFRLARLAAVRDTYRRLAIELSAR